MFIISLFSRLKWRGENLKVFEDKSESCDLSFWHHHVTWLTFGWRSTIGRGVGDDEKVDERCRNREISAPMDFIYHLTLLPVWTSLTTGVSSVVSLSLSVSVNFLDDIVRLIEASEEAVKNQPRKIKRRPVFCLLFTPVRYLSDQWRRCDRDGVRRWRRDGNNSVQSTDFSDRIIRSFKSFDSLRLKTKQIRAQSIQCVPSVCVIKVRVPVCVCVEVALFLTPRSVRNDAHFCGRRSRIGHIAPGATDSRIDRLHRPGRLRLHPPPRTPRFTPAFFSYSVLLFFFFSFLLRIFRVWFGWERGGGP